MNRNWFGLICKELTMSIDKLAPFLGDAISIKTSFKIFKYLIKLKKPQMFMDDREIICDNHIWTEIDLDSYVRNVLCQ